MMQDSLFSAARSPAQPSVGSVEGVSRVVGYIKRLIAQNKTLAGVRVRGEVSGKSCVGGRLYFDLKEQSDVLKCIVWASDAQKLPPFKDGDEIICGGDFGTFPARSQYQLFVRTVELSGIGALYAQFEMLKERFRNEGLFEQARKRPLPAFPRRIALISARGKGAEDFITTLRKRAPFIEVTFVETRVQGDGAQIDVGEAIKKASRLDVDVIVLTRGGGSYEDLFPFNLEPVVRAIVHARHPVLSAIGHTGDLHLCDYVADHTCETPSNAAQYFGEIGDRFAGMLDAFAEQLDRAMRFIAGGSAQRLDAAAKDLHRARHQCIAGRREQLHQLERRLGMQNPQQRLAQRHSRLVQLRSDLEAAARYEARRRRDRLGFAGSRFKRLQPSALAACRDRLFNLQTRLQALDPRAPLERGYAIVTSKGRTLRDAAAVSRGTRVEAQLARGKLIASVEETAE